MGRESEQATGSWLQKRLDTLDALYKRFGRDGFRDQPLTDVNLLLSSKELQLRDAAKGRDVSEQQKAANRHLEMEIQDIKGYVKGQLAGLSLNDLRSFPNGGRSQQQHQQQPFRQKDRDRER
jgi:hypothetical protein